MPNHAPIDLYHHECIKPASRLVASNVSSHLLCALFPQKLWFYNPPKTIYS